MRNPLLEQMILRELSIRGTPTRFYPLAYAVDFQIEQRELTIDEFLRTLQRLEEKGLIKKEKDLLDYTQWSITDVGKSALCI